MFDSESEDEISALWLMLRRRRKRPPSVWATDFLKERHEKGAHNSLVREVRENDVERFVNFHRMTPEVFDALLEKVEPFIRKANLTRESLSPSLRLSLTLRYLASGDFMVSLHYLYRVSKTSVTRIIPETCNAILEALVNEVLQLPNARDWEKIAEDFSSKWDFPNCLGAIDGKHVVIQCPDNTGSIHYNYKGSFSIVLMAICDANYKFTYVSIGAAGRESEGGVFGNTAVGKQILQQTLPIPQPKRLPGSNIVAPHVFVGDNAFPLRKNLMRPYPGTKLEASQIIFNYRLSRARRLIENTFGILVSKFRIFRKPIVASLSTADSIVKAAVVLHNYLRTADYDAAPRRRQYIHLGLVDTEDRDEHIEPGSWRLEAESMNEMLGIERSRCRNPTERAKEVQSNYKEYFMTYGQVPFQWRKLPTLEREFYSQL